MRDRVCPTILVHGLSLALACGTGGDEGDATAASGPLSASAGVTAPASAGSSDGDGTAGVGTDGAGAGGTEGGPAGDGASGPPPPKFDLGAPPDGGALPADEGCKSVDLLFVIDNSGSMADEQMNLVASFPGFVAAMQGQLQSAESFHLGVVTSDAYAANPAPCAQLGALVTRTGGDDSSDQDCLPYASGGRYMSEADDLAQKFQCAALVGTDGDGDERPMQAMARALGPQLAGPGACNQGFIREDALLVIVVISDEEDDHEVADACVDDPKGGSPGDPLDWYEGVVGIKGGLAGNVVVLALVGPPGPQACPALDKCEGGVSGAEVAGRIVQFTEMFTYGSVGQVCAPTYDQFFSDAIAVIESACENYQPPG